MTGVALQDQGWWPDNGCFGCGPVNAHGLRLKSFLRDDGELVATWRPEAHHVGPPGAVNGGVMAVPLDCHGSWRAFVAFREAADAVGDPTLGVYAVTGEYAVRLRRPTPVETDVHLVTELLHLEARRARVRVAATVADEVTATFEGTWFRVDA